MRASLVVLLLPAALPFAEPSCTRTEIRVRTEVGFDGSCTRQVVYRFAEIEEDGRKTGKPEIPSNLLLPDRSAWNAWSLEKTTLVASGFFPHPSRIPADFRFRGRREGRVLDRAVSYSRDDFVFFERHRWSERFREPVDRDAMEASLTEAVSTVVDLTREVAREALGGNFDLTEVERWLADDGTRLLRSLVLVWWESLLDEDADRTRRRVAARLSRDGLAVSAEDLEGGDPFPTVLAAFAKRLATLVRPPRPGAGRSPAPIDAGAVLSMLDPDRFLGLFEEKAAERFGGKEAAGKWFGERLDDLMGDLGGPNDRRLQFDWTLTLPGEVLRTNGVLLAPNEVLWRFTSGALFPKGMVLEAESVVVRPHALATLERSKGLLSRRDVLDLIETLTNDRGALRKPVISALEKGLEDRDLEKALARVAKVEGDLVPRLREILGDPALRKDE